MNRLMLNCFSTLLITCASVGANSGNDSSIQEHRVPRVSGRIVKVYSGNRPEPYLCNSEGYKADPHSCASFYRCVKERNGKFNVFRYQCAPGTVYDPDLDTCNHPKNTRRTECGGMIKSTDSSIVNEVELQKELPKPINTNSIAFIKATTVKENTETHKTTSQSTISTRSPLETFYQSPSTLAAYISDTTKIYQDYIDFAADNAPWTSNKEKYDWTKTTTQPKITSNSKYTENICSDDGFTGDTENCRKFYRCIGNQRGGFLKYEFFCSEATVWDEEIQSCNHPWAVKRSKCGRSMSFTNKKDITEPITTLQKSTTQKTTTAEYGQKIKTIQQQLQISHGSKVTQIQAQISHSNQVIQNQTQIHYGDRITPNTESKSRQNQTQIAHGSAVSQTQTQIDYGNKGMQTQLQVDHSKDASQSQTQIHESSTSQATTTKHDSNQNNICSESGFMGDSMDCKKFYRCVDSGRGTFTKYEYTCGEGTVWDQSIEACNHKWAVKDCGGHSNSETQPSSTVQSTTHHEYTTISSQSTSETLEPDIDDIDVGYGNQGQSETTTFSSTIHTKSTTKEPQHTTTIQNKPHNVKECNTSGFMGDSNNCKKFYRCVDNGMGGFTRHEFTCGEGTVWDSSIEACNHAWAVERCGGSGSSSESSQTSEPNLTTVNAETTTNTESVDKNTDKPIQTTASTTTNTESNKDNVCKQSGFMGDNKDCKKFYRCVENGDGMYTRYDFTCGEGTVWDSKIEACNHEWAVEKCGGNSQSSTPDYSPTSEKPILQDENKENEPTTQIIEGSSSTTITTTTTIRNEISSSDQDKCTSSGFVGDKNDCKKFYRCVDNGNGGYDRYQFSCGEGTVWDGSISACNHAWAVKECGAIGNISQSNNEPTSEGVASSTEIENQELNQHSTEKITSTTENPSENTVGENCENEGFFGSLTDCKKFIRCVDDGKGGFTKYEFTCGEGTTWNQNIAACDHPSLGRPCSLGYQPTTKNPMNDEMITETTTKMTLTTSSDKEGTQNSQKPLTTSGICESEGFIGDLSNCKKFYRCVNDGKGGYIKYDFTCGDGTVWNQEILACDHESNDKLCSSTQGSGPVEESRPQPEVTTSETSTSSSTTTSNQLTDKTESPTTSSNDKCTSEGFFGHPHDCKKFVRCVKNGDGGYTRYEFSCGEGTVWVQEIQACDHDTGDTNCRKQNGSTTKPQDNGSISTTESASWSTETQTQNKENDEYPTTHQPSEAESDKCTSEGYFANKNDCRKFYRCVDNGNGGYTKYDFDCGEGTAWDSNIDSCNHINEVESCSKNNNEESHTQHTMKDEESQTTESTSSTTKASTTTSESSEESGSKPNTESNDKCESEGYYGDSKDCRKFYRCVDDGKGGLTKYDFICGEGTIWDQDITNCNHPQDVTNLSCKSEGSGEEGNSQTSSTTSSTTSSSESTTLSSTSENSTQASSNCSQEESSKKPASSKDNISCEKAGYYPNPNDCKKFYRCVDWDGDGKRFSVFHFECGEGTIWDPALDTCNHEESVYPPRDCSQTQVQTESSTEESTTKKQDETTTQESTTSEQTTTQESTTSEQTTTHESTTSDKTTTEQEQTTSQQSTTSEPTTTQQSTTSEQTTTQESTTSEQTTTQQSTTSEQTTTQQSTTSEQTTTQESTTSEQTTTQESKPSEQTTTQQSTTSEQTTTQESTSEQTTTQESTTSEQTTQEPTTSEQTTQESTTSEQTTKQTTEESATEQTSEQTESSTTEGTTESSTTEADNGSTTEQSSTTESEQESTTQSSSDKECPETEDDQYLFVCPTSFKRHPKYCNMFYQCTKDDETHEVTIASFKCPNDTIYDESKTQCVEEKKADKKCDGKMARRHRFKRLNRDSKEPITVDTENKSCPSEGYYAFEKNVECSNGFLKCKRSKSGKLRGYVHQCPVGYLFWTISKRCELAKNIRDCKQSSNDWKGRWNIPIDRKNVAL